MAGTLQLKCFACQRTGAFRLPANPTWESDAVCLACGMPSRLLDLVYLADNKTALKDALGRKRRRAVRRKALSSR